MSVVDRIKKFLDDTEKIPLKDASGKIISPEGAEADSAASNPALPADRQRGGR